MGSECRYAETLIPQYVIDSLPDYEGSNDMDGDMWTALAAYIVDLEDALRKAVDGRVIRNTSLLEHLGITTPARPETNRRRPADMDWKRIEDEMPAPGFSVWAHYLNSHGKSRTVKACWVPAGFMEATDSDNGEYDEERDEYYCPEGWYELIDNWDEYGSIAIHEGAVSHWMPLPAPPAVINETEPAEAGNPQ